MEFEKFPNLRKWNLGKHGVFYLRFLYEISKKSM